MQSAVVWFWSGGGALPASRDVTMKNTAGAARHASSPPQQLFSSDQPPPPRGPLLLPALPATASTIPVILFLNMLDVRQNSELLCAVCGDFVEPLVLVGIRAPQSRGF